MGSPTILKILENFNKAKITFFELNRAQKKFVLIEKSNFSKKFLKLFFSL